jgi:leucine dehydrogenase
MIETLMTEWDGEGIHLRFDRPSGSWIVIAIHSTRLGPAIGGTRMKGYPDLDAAVLDAQRLAAGMTYKWAATDMEAGGGKAVIAVSGTLDGAKRASLLRRYGRLIASLGGLFLTGPDSGTTSADMDLIAREAPGSVFCRSIEAGGSGNPAIFTARGVFVAVQASLERVFGTPDLDGRTVAVQGAGSVGGELIALMREAGAAVAAADVDARALEPWAGVNGVEVVATDEIYDVSCDVFSPCALGAVLGPETIPRLRCRVVAGAANNQLSRPEDAATLEQRGILYAPDFVANSGGAIAALGIEIRGWSRRQAEEQVTESVGANLREIFSMAEQRGFTTDLAGRSLAEGRLGTA